MKPFILCFMKSFIYKIVWYTSILFFAGHCRCISIFHRGFYFILLFENTPRDASARAQEYHFEHF